MRLLDLPPEILLQVINILKVPRIPNPGWETSFNFLRASTADLKPMSLVSKVMRALTAPFMFEDVAPSFSEILLISSQANPSGFLANPELTRLARSFRFPDRYELEPSDTKDVFSESMSRLPEILGACSELQTILDLDIYCLEYAAVMKAINDHPTLSSAWLDISPYFTSSARYLASLQPDGNLLRKFRGTLAGAPRFPLKPSLQAMLDQGYQVHRVHLEPNLDSESLQTWLESSYLTTTEEFEFYGFEEDANISAILASAPKKHHIVSQIKLINMSISMIHRVCGLGEIPQLLTTAIRYRVASAECYVDGDRTLCCSVLVVTSESMSFHVQGGSIDDGLVSLTDLLDVLSSSFPLLRELSMTLPWYLSVSDDYTLAMDTVIPQEDHSIVQSFSKLKNLKKLTLFVNTSLEEGILYRLETVIVMMFEVMPDLHTVNVNPREDLKDWPHKSGVLVERDREQERLHVQTHRNVYEEVEHKIIDINEDKESLS